MRCSCSAFGGRLRYDGRPTPPLTWRCGSAPLHSGRIEIVLLAAMKIRPGCSPAWLDRLRPVSGSPDAAGVGGFAPLSPTCAHRAVAVFVCNTGTESLDGWRAKRRNERVVQGLRPR